MLYAAADWLVERQGKIEKKLAARQLTEGEMASQILYASRNATLLKGRIVGISFHDTSKSRDHHIYNVELRIRPAQDTSEEVLVCFVDKVFWSRLSTEEQARIAPEGPAPLLLVDQWKNYEVGKAVVLAVDHEQPGIAILHR